MKDPCFANRLRAWLLAAGVAVGGCLLASPNPATAPAAESADALSFRRVFVPAERVDAWPTDGRRFLPIAADEFRRLVEVAQQVVSGAPADDQPMLLDATYTARFELDALVDGTARLRVVHRADHASVLALAPCSLAVALPSWNGDPKQPAVLGNFPTSGLGVLVNQSGTLRFAWSLRARRETGNEPIFHLRLPAGPTKRVQIDLPDGSVPVTNQGRVTKLAGAAQRRQLWQIELGSHTEVVVRVSSESAAAAWQRVPRMRQLLTYDLTPRGVEISAQWLVDTPDKPLRHVTFSVDPNVRVVAAKVGDTEVPWSVARGKATGPKHVTLELAEPMQGAGRVVRMAGFAPFGTSRRYRLPQMRCAAKAWESALVRLVVPQPLVLERLELRDCRQTKSEPINAPRSGESIELEAFSPAADIAVRVARPDARLAVITGTTLSIGVHEATARVVADCAASGSETYALSVPVAAEWITEAVQSEPVSALASWTVERTGDGMSQLEVQLTRALTPKRPVRLIVTGRLRQLALGQQFSIADLEMLRFDRAGGTLPLMLVRAVEPYQLSVTGDEQLKLRHPARLSAQQATLVDNPGQGLLFDVDWAAAPLHVSLVRSPSRFAGEIRVDATVLGQSLEESYLFQCLPESARIQRLNVRFAQPLDPPLRFTLVGASEQELATRRLDAEQPSPSGPTAGGQIWEVTLPRALNEPFQVRGTRMRALDGPTRINLASLPDATTQRGRIAVRLTGTQDVVIEPRGLDPMLADTVPPDAYSNVRAVFRYEPARSAFATVDPVLTLRPMATDQHQPMAWIWHGALDSRSAPDGTTVHMATYHIENRGRGTVSWTLPDGATLKAVWVDGLKVPHSGTGTGARPLVVNLPSGRRFPQLAMEFATRDSALGVVGTRRPRMPRCNIPIVSCQWSLWLPPGYEVTDRGPSAHLPGESSWRQRLFGPLGRAPGSQPFDPLRLADWWRLADPGRSRRQAQVVAGIVLERLGAALGHRQPGTPKSWGALIGQAAAADARPPTALLIDAAALARTGVTPASPLPPPPRGTPDPNRAVPRAAALLQRSELALVVHPRAAVLTSARVAACYPSRFVFVDEGGRCRQLPDAWGQAANEPLRTTGGGPLVPARRWAAEPVAASAPWSSFTWQAHTTTGWSASEWNQLDGTPVLARIIHRDGLYVLGLLVFGIVAVVAYSKMGGRPGLSVACLGMGGAAAFVLPEAWAVPATGTFLGMLAGLLGRCLRPSPDRAAARDEPSSSPRVAPTQTALVPAIALVAALASPCAQADELLAANPQSASPTAAPPVAAGPVVHTVLIPIDGSRHPVGSKVYVSEAHLQALYRRDAQGSRRPRDWVLTGATYRAALAPGPAPRQLVVDDLTAIFDLVVFDRLASITIPFRSEDAAWVPGQARLDGRPTELKWASDGSALALVVDEPGPYRLTLSMQPAPPGNGPIPGFSLAIPRLASARLELAVPDDLDDLDDLRLPNVGGAVERDRQRGTVIVHLGPRTRLSVGMTTPQSDRAAVTDIRAAELLWLHVRPGAVVLEAKFNVGVRYGHVRALRLTADPRLRLLPLAEDSPIEAVRSETAAQQQVVLKLKRAINQQVTVPTRWLLTGYSGVGNLRLPHLAVESDRTSKRLLAVSVDPALAYRENRQEPLTTVAIPDFAQAWGDAEAKPLFAYELPSREPMWSLATRPRATRTTAQQTLKVSAGDGTTDVRFDARITTIDGYQCQVCLSAPAGLDIESISVQHNGAEKTARWARGGAGRITVFLTAPVSGQAVLSLRGRLPTEVPGRVPLPTIDLEAAEVTASRVRIYRQESVLVRVADVVGLRAIKQTDPGPGDPNQDRLVGVFSVEKQPAGAALVLRANRPRITGAAVTTVGWRGDTSYADFDLRLRVEQGKVDDIRLEVSPWWDGPYEIHPQARVDVFAMPGRDLRRLVIRLPKAVTGAYHLHVGAPLKTTDDLRLRVPRIAALHAGQVEQFLVLPTRFEQQQLVWKTRRLRPAELPGGMMLGLEPRYAPRVVQIVGKPFTAEPTTVPEVSRAPRIRLADIRLATRRNGSAAGVATFDLLPAGLTDCVLVLPADCSLMQVAVEGMPAEVRHLGNRRWRLMLASAVLPQRIGVLYSADATARGWWRPSRTWQAPALHVSGQQVGIGRTLWTLFGSAAHRHGTAAEEARIDRLPQEMVRLESIASLFDLPREIADQVPVGERTRWYRGWARRLLVGLDQVGREARGRADGRAARSRAQALAAEETDIGNRLGVGAHLAQLRREASPAREYDELFGWTVPDSLPAQRFVFPGAHPALVEHAVDPIQRDFVRRLTAAVMFAGAVWILLTALRRRWCRDLWWRWPQAVGVAFGLAWWLWLWPSVLGWVLIALVGLWTVRRRWSREGHAGTDNDDVEQIVVA